MKTAPGVGFVLPARVFSNVIGRRSAAYCALLLAFAATADEVDYSMARAAMVDEVHFYATLARDTGEAALDEDVMQSLGTVERHEFVPARERRFAYENRPLRIGHGQTISQPYIVALMTDLIEPDRDFVVLEIGTGSGYQAAILAKLVTHVYSIEIIEALADEAAARLARLGYDNVTTKLGDGGRKSRASATDPAAQTRWPHDHPGRRAVHDPAAAVTRENR